MSANNNSGGEFKFGCDCGEEYRTAGAAWECKNCPIYLTDADYRKRKVFDLKTGRSTNMKLLTRNEFLAKLEGI